MDMTTNPNPFSQPGQVETWLDGCEQEPVHPAAVEDRLRRSGWYPQAAAATASSYRRRFNEHALGYSALLVTTGLVALAAGGSCTRSSCRACGTDVDTRVALRAQ